MDEPPFQSRRLDARSGGGSAANGAPVRPFPVQRSGISSSIIDVVFCACCATWSTFMPMTVSG